MKKSRAVWEDCGRCDDFDARDHLYICHFCPDKQGVKQKRQGVNDCIGPHGVAHAWIHLPTTRGAPRDGFARLPSKPSARRAGGATAAPSALPPRAVEA